MSLVRVIQAGGGKIIDLFFQCSSNQRACLPVRTVWVLAGFSTWLLPVSTFLVLHISLASARESADK